MSWAWEMWRGGSWSCRCLGSRTVSGRDHNHFIAFQIGNLNPDQWETRQDWSDCNQDDVKDHSVRENYAQVIVRLKSCSKQGWSIWLGLTDTRYVLNHQLCWSTTYFIPFHFHHYFHYNQITMTSRWLWWEGWRWRTLSRHWCRRRSAGSSRTVTTSTSPTSRTGWSRWVTPRRTWSQCTATSWRTSATCWRKSTRWVFLSWPQLWNGLCQLQLLLLVTPVTSDLHKIAHMGDFHCSALPIHLVCSFQACLPFILLPVSSSRMYIFHDRYSCTKLAEMLIWVIFRTTTRSTTSAPSVLTTSRSSTTEWPLTPLTTTTPRSLARWSLFARTLTSELSSKLFYPPFFLWNRP